VPRELEEVVHASGLTRILTVSTCLAFVAIVLAVPSPGAALEAYLIVQGASQGAIQGDSTAKVAPNGIVVQAIGLGLTFDVSAIGTGASTGRADVAPLKIAKLPDKASPKLLLAALTGESLKVDLIWFGPDLPGGPASKTFSITLESRSASSSARSPTATSVSVRPSSPAGTSSTT
jgi:type VI secretion system Hcp family effector